MIEIEPLLKITRQAADEIMKIYADDFEVKFKDDHSPVTLADLKSNSIIVNFLKNKYPHIPIISEENKTIPYEERKGWGQLWLIDPLDGTKEFMKKNGEFTINIALIENQATVFGLVSVPAKNIIYYSKKGAGSYKIDHTNKKTELKAKEFKMDSENLTLVCSRSHMSKEVEEYLKSFKNPKTISMGSSLKFILLAEGNAEIYPRLAPTMEWDTAAAHAILNEAGGTVVDAKNGKELLYNKENLKNPHFIAMGNVYK